MLGRIEKTTAPEEPAEPPTLAATGVVRWSRCDKRGGPIRVRVQLAQ
jgi:hypothetical protein